MKFTITLLLCILSLNLNAQYKNNTWTVLRLEYEGIIDSNKVSFIRIIDRVHYKDSYEIIKSGEDSIKLCIPYKPDSLNLWISYTDYSHTFRILDSLNAFHHLFAPNDNKDKRIKETYENRWKIKNQRWKYSFSHHNNSDITFTSEPRKNRKYAKHKFNNQLTFLDVSTSEYRYRIHIFTYYEIPVEYFATFGNIVADGTTKYHGESFTLLSVLVIE
ncbi:MAG: hypothetical protein IT244_10155 [Bacteroidia bacterium]|nr:hypothetical protein [Bacteroidia bacterium]